MGFTIIFIKHGMSTCINFSLKKNWPDYTDLFHCKQEVLYITYENIS